MVRPPILKLVDCAQQELAARKGTPARRLGVPKELGWYRAILHTAPQDMQGRVQGLSTNHEQWLHITYNI